MLRSAGLLLPWFALWASCGPPPGAGAEGGPGHGVLLIAVDALRADHLSGFGYDRKTTPFLDQLAAEGARLAHTFAAAPQRAPAHASLLTGSDPNLARRDVPQWLEASLEQPWFLPPAVPRLAAEFLVNGAATAAFVDHPDVAVGFGFAAGFQTFEPLWDLPPGESPGAERLVARTLQWVRSQPEGGDWFVYLHLSDLERVWSRPDPRFDTYFEPRAGWDGVPAVGASEPALFALPPSRFGGGALTLGQYQARYDGALRRLDGELRTLAEGLDAMGRGAHTSVAVVGAFGLQFGEAGLILDSGRLSVADLKVPFLVRPAPARHGRLPLNVIPGLASSMDVAPTLLDLAGHPVPRAMQGQSLWPALLSGSESPRRHAFASCAIQSGYAAFDGHRAVEVHFFGRGSRAALAMGWFGEALAGGESTEERFYNWMLDPFPPLHRPSDLDYEDTLELKGAAVRWVDHVEQLRRAVHEPAVLWGAR